MWMRPMIRCTGIRKAVSSMAITGTIAICRCISSAGISSPDPYTALGYDPGFSSHGTHTTSISASNGRSGGPVGLAPEALLIFVHLSTYTAEGPTLLGDSVALFEAFDFIARVAGPRPLVVNCSLGRHAGQHDGRTLTEQGVDAFLRAAAGRACIWSTGNYFNRSIHVQGTLRPGETRTLRLVTDVADRTPNEVDLWYPGADRFQITLRGPGGTPEVRIGPGERSPVIIDRREVGRLYHSLGDPNNGDNQVTLFLYRAAPPGEWELILFGEDVGDGRFHAWVERDAACKGCQARFARDDSDPTSTTGTICNGLWTLAVGAYDAHQEDHALAPFSSSGPTRDGRQKPDLVAPGVRVLAARSRPRLGGPDAPHLTRMSGTSMAAPHVTGTVALMFEAAGRPLPIAETRRLLLANVDLPADDVEPMNRLRLGSGYLNTAAAVAAAKQAGRRPHLPVAPLSSETPADPDEINQSERYEPMSASSDETAGPDVARSDETTPPFGEDYADTDEGYDPMPESGDEATEYDLAEYDAEAKRDHRRDHRRLSRRVVSPSPFQVQVPLTGGAPALAVPVGGYRSPLAFTVPLGGTPPATSLPPMQTGGPASPPPSAPQTRGPVSPMPSAPQIDGPIPSSPAGSAPPVAPATEPVAPEPPVSEPLATEPHVTVASPDFPLYVPPAPGDMGTKATGQPVEYEEYDAEAKRDTRFSPSPFQVQVPLTGGAPGLALPFGGYGSPLAFTVPLGGTPPAVSPSPVQTASPTLSPTTEPFTSEPAVTVASPDSPLYVPPPEAEVNMEAMEDPEPWQELDTSEWSPVEWDALKEAESPEHLEVESEPTQSFSMSETTLDFGERVLAAAEAAAESDDTATRTSAALLEVLLGSSSEVEMEPEAEGLAIPLSPLGRRGPPPSATTLFNTFVYPNHPLRPRNALYRHYAHRFEVVARPGQAMLEINPCPGDLILRVAQGEGWGHVAVVASQGAHRHDQLGTAGLRGEGYPRPRPGLYIQVVEVCPRRRRRADWFARRLSDSAGLVLLDTLVLRPLSPRQSPAEAEPGSDTTPGAAGPLTSGPTERPLALRSGDTGPAVREAERKLNRVHADAVALGLPGLAGCPLVEDGRFGERMEMAVRSFQQQVLADPTEWNGIIGPKTWAQLDLLTGTGTPSTSAAFPSPAGQSRSCSGGSRREEGESETVPLGGSKPTIRRGSRGPAVREAQGKLNAVHARQLAAGAPGLPACPLTEDGIFGDNTFKAVRAFQQLAFPSQPQEWDGIVGPKTWVALERFTVRPIPVPPVPPIVPVSAVACGNLLIWINAFIPRDVPNYTFTIPAGPHKGATAIPCPLIATPVNPNCFRLGYLTDQRSFDDDPTKSVRMRSIAAIQLVPPKLIAEDHISSGTTEINKNTGAVGCVDFANMSRCKFKDFRVEPEVQVVAGNPVVTGNFFIKLSVKAAASDPCVNLAADIDYEGDISIFCSPRGGLVEVNFSGKIDSFPAFEMYASLNGVTKPFFQVPPPSGNTVADLLGGASTPVAGRATFSCILTPAATSVQTAGAVTKATATQGRKGPSESELWAEVENAAEAEGVNRNSHIPGGSRDQRDRSAREIDMVRSISPLALVQEFRLRHPDDTSERLEEDNHHARSPARPGNGDGSRGQIPQSGPQPFLDQGGYGTQRNGRRSRADMGRDRKPSARVAM